MLTLFAGGPNAARVTVSLLLRLFSRQINNEARRKQTTRIFDEVIMHWYPRANERKQPGFVIKCKIRNQF